MSVPSASGEASGRSSPAWHRGPRKSCPHPETSVPSVCLRWLRGHLLPPGHQLRLLGLCIQGPPHSLEEKHRPGKGAWTLRQKRKGKQKNDAYMGEGLGYAGPPYPKAAGKEGDLCP